MPKREIPSALQPRNGLNPTRVRMPVDQPTGVNTALEYLQLRFPDSADRISQLVTAGQVYHPDGEPIGIQSPYQGDHDLFLFRDPPADEPTVPELADLRILFQDDELLVIDKPHRVSVIPRGRWVTQTALVYLRTHLDLPQLSPVHRLDRQTAGVLVFTKNPQHRGAYQTLFQQRQVRKQYLAVTAAPDPDSPLLRSLGEPRLITSRIVKIRGIAPAQEVPGEPNAETTATLLQVRGAQALWRLQPKTGKTHQLRLHLNSLGLPILGDPFWPELRPEPGPGQDPGLPLQLLAKVIEFIDPLTGEQRRFESNRQLSCFR